MAYYAKDAGEIDRIFENMVTVSKESIELTKETLDRNDGIHLTDIEAPNIISAYVPPVVNAGSIVLVKPVVEAQKLLERVDDHFRKVQEGTIATLKRFSIPKCEKYDFSCQSQEKAPNGRYWGYGGASLPPVTTDNVSDLRDNVIPESKAVASLVASTSGFVAQSQIAPSVKFSPFKFSVWNRSGSIAGGSSKEELRAKQIPVGTYIITLKTPVGFKNQSELSGSIPFKVDGKQAVLEKVKYYPDENLVKIQVRIVQNLVLILSVIGASLLAGGYLVGNLEDLVETSVESVDRVVETSIVVAIAGGVGWFALKKFGVL